MKQVKVIREVIVNGETCEDEYTFSSDCFPMAKHFADCWAKRSGYKLVKSSKKIADMFMPYRTAVSKDEVIWYAVKKSVCDKLHRG